METKANFLLIGIFTLATIVGGFFFVLWFSGLGRVSEHKTYQVVFSGSVSGLSRGSSVLFNGLKVGEVTLIDFLENDPSRVAAMIDVSGRTPMMEDTKARLELQGLTGAAAIALTGGSVNAKPLVSANGAPPVIYADRSDFQNLLENVQRLSAKADDVIGKVDKLIGDNGPAITDTLKNVDEFSKLLGNSSSGINAFLSGAGDLGKKIGPLASRLQVLSDDVDKLVQAVDTDKVRGVVDDVAGFTRTLRDNKGHIDSLLTDAASLAKRLNETSDKLDSALASIRDVAKTIDSAKISDAINNVASAAGSVGNIAKSVDTDRVRGVIDNVEGFTATLNRNQGHIDSVLTDAASLAKRLNATSDKLDSALASVSDLAKSIDGAKISSAIDNVAGAADSVGKIAKSVDTDKVRGVIDNVEGFTATLNRNQGHIDSLLADAADLAKHLNGTTDTLNGALGDFRDLAKSLDRTKIAGAVDNVSEFTQSLRDNKGNVDRMLKDASELAAKLNNSADKVDALMQSLQGFVGSPETKGALTEVGDAAKSVRQLAEDLNARTKDIAAGLTRFTGSGLREYEALAIDGRRTINDLDRAVRSFERSPNQLIFGAKPALPEYHGGP
jgi:phospholipid/cholesterol/gamma-HCH transport system substrate-binding protein